MLWLREVHPLASSIATHNLGEPALHEDGAKVQVLDFGDVLEAMRLPNVFFHGIKALALAPLRVGGWTD